MSDNTLNLSAKKWGEVIRTEWTQLTEALADFGQLTAHYNRPGGTKARLYTLSGSTIDLPIEPDDVPTVSALWHQIAREIRARVPRAAIYRDGFSYAMGTAPHMNYAIKIAPGPRLDDVASVGLFLEGLMRRHKTVESAADGLNEYLEALVGHEHILIEIDYRDGVLPGDREMLEVILRTGKPFDLRMFLYATLNLW